MTTEETYRLLDARLVRIEAALDRISERVGLHGELIAETKGDTNGRRAVIAALSALAGGIAGALASTLLPR